VLKNLLFWIAFSWTVVVAFFCLTPSNNIPSINIPNLDKLAHAFFHFVFTLLWFLFFKKQVKKRNETKLLVFSCLFSVLFGLAIEIIQAKFSPTRSGELLDVLANLSGAILAFILVLFIKKIKT
jgi:VanZ family protein